MIQNIVRKPHSIMKSLQRVFPLLFLMLAANSASCQKTKNINSLIPFSTGLTSPVCITNSGDSRLFVADQHGYIRIVDSTGKINPQPFLDIHGRVIFGGERGLLGQAFHPQYMTNGYFYVNYVGEGDSTHISRFNVRSDNPDLADSLSELKLMTIFQPYQNHKGGDLSFGPDGFLYIGLGDGGSAGDPDNRAQNKQEYLGKMLRINVDEGNPYAIPATNPFYNTTTALGEIWALGLRNPWRFSFDRLTGDLWIADVGQNLTEEIDFQPAASMGGENYGWRCYEGNQIYNGDGCAPSSSFTFPVYTYPHGDECSITGGYVYRGSTSSAFYGYYFFADYCSDRIWTLHKVFGNWVKEEYGQFPGNNFSTFGEDASGQLYIAGTTSGTIFQINNGPTDIISNDISRIKIIQDPFSDKIRIETGRNDPKLIHLTIFDTRGIKLYNTITKVVNYEFNLSFLPAGIYFLNIGIDGKNLVHKIIKGK